MSEKNERFFDSNLYPRRKIALLFYYFGWKFDGLVVQETTENTVEQHIVTALKKTKLIDDVKEADISRCGRTDKGVSAFQQVIAVTVRSSDENGKYVYWKDGSKPINGKSLDKEMPFCTMLNRFLPSDIRIMAWSPVRKDFSARHNCLKRVYRYFLPCINLSISSMSKACQFLKGEHDFRNFCHIDKSKALRGLTHVRKIYEAEILEPECIGINSYVLKISASGFLWHQIRCIVSLLLEIGRGRENPELILDLLNITKFPSRPVYNLASEIPLCLYENNYSDEDIEWIWEEKNKKDTLVKLQKEFLEYQTKANIINDMLKGFGELSGQLVNDPSNNGFDEFMFGRNEKKAYIPISKRPLCKGIDEIKEDLVKKKSKNM
ncbi:tRNA pseudouridine(38/39) synthase [Strongyloides ratti]|uniref:tRNA pseudouridine synthase n=1 Tax=Strongyloides ratti TaxID=34506 RepID=A0A090LIG0_STRRB|nr:tRNA pseudouridine(38/39) synthase [Strongyloides ratti]CEF67933.1 tRNA pseudouridine(38/39) synthase [Strongyloides ratti]